MAFIIDISYYYQLFEKCCLNFETKKKELNLSSPSLNL